MKRILRCAVCAVMCAAPAAVSADQSALSTAQAMLSANAFAATQEALSIATAGDAGPAKMTDRALYLRGIGDALSETWLSVHGKGYDGSRRGHAVTVTVGRDIRKRDGLRFGLAVSGSRAALDLGGTRTHTASASVGPYLKRRLGKKVSLSGWALLTMPRYRLDRDRATGLRWSGALSASGRINADAADMVGRLKLSGYGEVDRGRGLRLSRHKFRAHAEGKSTFRPGMALRPYVGLTTDLGIATRARAKSTSRVSAGMAYRRDHTRMSFDIKSGPLERPGARTIRISYGWTF